MCFAALLCLVGSASAFGQATGDPWGKRIFGDDMIRVILHADDAGMAPAANSAVQAYLDGSVNSASAMVPLDYFEGPPSAGVPSMVEWYKLPANKDEDLGLHLTLTNEWPRETMCGSRLPSHPATFAGY